MSTSNSNGQLAAIAFLEIIKLGAHAPSRKEKREEAARNLSLMLQEINEKSIPSLVRQEFWEFRNMILTLQNQIGSTEFLNRTQRFAHDLIQKMDN
jgi:hypothetical protein